MSTRSSSRVVGEHGCYKHSPSVVVLTRCDLLTCSSARSSDSMAYPRPLFWIVIPSLPPSSGSASSESLG
jgi:hypothetical protein